MAEFPNLRSWLLGLEKTPRLARGYGLRLMWAFGATFDAVATGVEAAVVSRFIKYAPPDALLWIGKERGIARGLGESWDQYRGRLQAAWRAWAWAGTRQGMLEQLTAAGYPGADIVESFQWDSPWPHDASQWSRFWVVFPVGTHPWTTSIPDTDKRVIASVINQWRPAHVVCVSVIAIVRGRIRGYPLGGTTRAAAHALAPRRGDNFSLRFTP